MVSFGYTNISNNESAPPKSYASLQTIEEKNQYIKILKNKKKNAKNRERMKRRKAREKQMKEQIEAEQNYQGSSLLMSNDFYVKSGYEFDEKLSYSNGQDEKSIENKNNDDKQSKRSHNKRHNRSKRAHNQYKRSRSRSGSTRSKSNQRKDSSPHRKHHHHHYSKHRKNNEKKKSSDSFHQRADSCLKKESEFLNHSTGIDDNWFFEGQAKFSIVTPLVPSQQKQPECNQFNLSASAFSDERIQGTTTNKNFVDENMQAFPELENEMNHDQNEIVDEDTLLFGSRYSQKVKSNEKDDSNNIPAQILLKLQNQIQVEKQNEVPDQQSIALTSESKNNLDNIFKALMGKEDKVEESHSSDFVNSIINRNKVQSREFKIFSCEKLMKNNNLQFSYGDNEDCALTHFLHKNSDSKIEEDPNKIEQKIVSGYSRILRFPPIFKTRGKINCVLDLDLTLVQSFPLDIGNEEEILKLKSDYPQSSISSFNYKEAFSEFTPCANIPESLYMIVVLRPYVLELFSSLSKWCNFYLYTHGDFYYASKLISDYLDQKGIYLEKERVSAAKPGNIETKKNKNLATFNFDDENLLNTFIFDDQPSVWSEENHKNVIGSKKFAPLHHIDKNFLNFPNNKKYSFNSAIMKSTFSQGYFVDTGLPHFETFDSEYSQIKALIEFIQNCYIEFCLNQEATFTQVMQNRFRRILTGLVFSFQYFFMNYSEYPAINESTKLQYKDLISYMGGTIDEYSPSITHYLFLNYNQMKSPIIISNHDQNSMYYAIHAHWILDCYYFMNRVPEEKFLIHFN